jgi:hypothetical protein
MLNQSVLANLILYIVYQLNDMGRQPSTIQLVKYIYLIDTEHQRSLEKTLTGLTWINHHFGPYAFALPKITSGIGFDLSTETFTTEGHEGHSYKVEREAKFPEELGPVAQMIVDRVLKVWGLASTREMLDYIYFETEPMIYAEFGDVLDFIKVEPEIGAYQISFKETKKLMKLRERIISTLGKTARVKKRITDTPDDLFFEVMDSMDDVEG